VKPVLLAAVSAVFVACSSVAVPGGSAVPSARPTTPAGPTAAPPAAGGTWTGTIAVTAAVDRDETTEGSSGDPGSAYYSTYVVHDTVQADATDVFAITASDPEDLEYGIHSVELGGTATNSGTTLERYVTVSQKQNSSCTWTEEVGTETEGAFTGSGVAVGDLRFSEDGTYTIEIYADPSGPDGSYETPQVPQRLFERISNRSADCVGDGHETETTQGPLIWWASSSLGGAAVDGQYATIEGQLDADNPGSTVAGSATWDMASPEGLTLTVTWNLAHDGPITLPNSGPAEPDLY
jgi:hypothetical protein